MSNITLSANSSISMDRLPPATLRQMICDETVRACVTSLGAGLDAIILTGSVARNEASIAIEHETMIVRGDAEFLVLFEKGASVPTAQAAERVAKIVQSRLRQRNIVCRIGLSPVSAGFLESMTPHIFGFELRHCGRVVWGDRNALARISFFEASQIPLDDAVRLLCNRMIELLELVSQSGLQSKAAQYATIKLYLDMATSFLVFAGAYRPTYEERVREIERISADTPAANTPFPLSAFAEKVQYCTQRKLAIADRSSAAPPDGSEVSEQLFVDGVRLAHQLWRWELQRMLDLDPKTSDGGLLTNWADSQPRTAKLRGWVRVMRDAGSADARRNWKRWLRLAGRTSPRLGVYAAGCQLFFRIPQLMQGRQTELFEDVSNPLPVLPDGGVNGNIAWPLMANSIAENYHRFVEFTRT